MKVSEPKLVNSIKNIIIVNSFKLGCLHAVSYIDSQILLKIATQSYLISLVYSFYEDLQGRVG